MRGWKWIAGAMVVMAVLVSACGGGDDSSSDADETSTDVAVDEPTEDGTEEPADDEPTEVEDEPIESALSADDLEAVVLSGWDMIWDEDFSSLLGLYTEDCRAQLVVEDFEATLGVGVDNLEQLGIDTADIGVEVAVSDFVEGTSATSTSTLTFPGEDASDEDPSSWVVENGAWRRADCDDIAGAGAGAEELGIGSIEQPASFGSAYDMDDWRATIVGIADPAAEGLLASFSEPPPAGQIDVMVTYAAMYFGDEIGTVDPFLVTGVGSAEYPSFESSCALDGVLLAEQEVYTLASALPGQQLVYATCLTVPEDEIDSMLFRIEHAFSPVAPIVHFSVDGETVEDPGPREVPTVDLTDGAIGFEETIPLGLDWTFQLLDVVDGEAEGLMSEFGQEAPAGSTHAVVIYEATYSGAEESVSDPFTIEGLGSAVYASLTSPCSVDLAVASTEYGVAQQFEFTPGETYRGASCLTLPLEELDTLVIKADNVFDFDAQPVRFVR